MNRGFWKGKVVVVTGHTGFKGSWLSMWLSSLGAKVYGISLEEPVSEPNLYSVAKVSKFINRDIRCDIRNVEDVRSVFSDAKPDIVFHLAAQPIVRESYNTPLYTLQTNVLGTAHILEAIRDAPSVKVGVMITTDKVYKNREWNYPYREVDELGANDPYSSSKACAEIIIDSYRKAFLEKQGKGISSARAGNVLGGGDWGQDRLIPDAMRALSSNEELTIRNPKSIRPWQFVLEPTFGYLQLAQAQWNEPEKFSRAWNFAPYKDTRFTVKDIAELSMLMWGSTAKVKISSEKDALHETKLLNLDSSLARVSLDWRQKYNIEKCLEETVSWYRAFMQRKDMQEFSLRQIKEYEKK